MNPKNWSMPVIFIVAAFIGAAGIVLYEVVRIDSFFRRLWDNPSASVYFALATVMFALLVGFVVALIRELVRARRPEMADYRQAVKSGQPHGDVRHWPDWIRHDLKINAGLRLGFATVCLVFGVSVVVIEAWWAGVSDLAVGFYCVWDYWRTRRRLHVIRENLTAATV